MYSASSLVFQLKYDDVWRRWIYQLLCMFGSNYLQSSQGKFFKVISLEIGKGHYLRIVHLASSLDA